jgi:hydroxyacyl-ACP dehydratase HTD2-like protein with hotdog domain
MRATSRHGLIWCQLRMCRKFLSTNGQQAYYGISTARISCYSTESNTGLYETAIQTVRRRTGNASSSHIGMSDEHLDFASLRAEMLARPAQKTYDVLTATNAHLLNLQLIAFLPLTCFLPPLFNPTEPHRLQHEELRALCFPLPETYHFVYFPLQVPSDCLLPDGTDPFQSPGPAWPRRLWSGGAITWKGPLPIENQLLVCTETIEDVSLRGDWMSGNEKILVDLIREYSSPKKGSADDIDQASMITERRRLVFLRHYAASSDPVTPRRGLIEPERATLGSAGSRHIEPSSTATGTSDSAAQTDPRTGFEKDPYRGSTEVKTWNMIPTRALLANYSALSYNAHRIHLDPVATRKYEGMRDILVHGPLSLTLMVRFLQSCLRPEDCLISIDYRHNAPLYVEESLRICVQRRSNDSSKRKPKPLGETHWSVWIEGPDGRAHVSARAVVRTKQAGR